MRDLTVRLVAGILCLTAANVAAAADAPALVVRLQMEGIIDAVSARYLAGAMAKAGRQGAQLVIITLDTPGGTDRSMRDAVQSLLNAGVPSAVYVSPAGSRAASAGAFLCMAANLAVMAPGTAMGAAHPVDLQGRSASEKITNDAEAFMASLAQQRGRNAATARAMVRRSLSLPAREAVAAGVADFMAADVGDCLRQADGRRLATGQGERLLALGQAKVADWPMTAPERFIHALSNPNLAYVLFLLGIFGLIYELASPGAIFPGVAGAISLVLGLQGLESLPISLAGVVLLALGAGLLVLELLIVSHGILAAGGLAAMILGSLMMFPSRLPEFRVAAGILWVMIAVSCAFTALSVYLALRFRHARAQTGIESLVGKTGRILAGGRIVHVQGEDWTIVPESGTFHEGEQVEVTGVEGLRLRIRPLAGPNSKEETL